MSVDELKQRLGEVEQTAQGVREQELARLEERRGKRLAGLPKFEQATVLSEHRWLTQKMGRKYSAERHIEQSILRESRKELAQEAKRRYEEVKKIGDAAARRQALADLRNEIRERRLGLHRESQDALARVLESLKEELRQGRAAIPDIARAAVQVERDRIEGEFERKSRTRPERAAREATQPVRSLIAEEFYGKSRGWYARTPEEFGRLRSDAIVRALSERFHRVPKEVRERLVAAASNTEGSINAPDHDFLRQLITPHLPSHLFEFDAASPEEILTSYKRMRSLQRQRELMEHGQRLASEAGLLPEIPAQEVRASLERQKEMAWIDATLRANSVMQHRASMKAFERNEKLSQEHSRPIRSALRPTSRQGTPDDQLSMLSALPESSPHKESIAMEPGPLGTPSVPIDELLEKAGKSIGIHRRMAEQARLGNSLEPHKRALHELGGIALEELTRPTFFQSLGEYKKTTGIGHDRIIRAGVDVTPYETFIRSREGEQAEATRKAAVEPYISQEHLNKFERMLMDAREPRGVDPERHPVLRRSFEHYQGLNADQRHFSHSALRDILDAAGPEGWHSTAAALRALNDVTEQYLRKLYPISTENTMNSQQWTKLGAIARALHEIGMHVLLPTHRIQGIGDMGGKRREALAKLVTTANDYLGVKAHRSDPKVAKAVREAAQWIRNRGLAPAEAAEEAKPLPGQDKPPPHIEEWQHALASQTDFFDRARMSELGAFIAKHAPFFHAINRIGTEYQKTLRENIMTHATRLVMRQDAATREAGTNSYAFRAALRHASEFHLGDAKFVVRNALRNIYGDHENSINVIMEDLHPHLQEWIIHRLTASAMRRLKPTELGYSRDMLNAFLKNVDDKDLDAAIARMHRASVQATKEKAAEHLSNAHAVLARHLSDSSDARSIIESVKSSLRTGLRRAYPAPGGGKPRRTLQSIVEALRQSTEQRHLSAGWYKTIESAYGAARRTEELIGGPHTPLDVSFVRVIPTFLGDPHERAGLSAAQLFRRLRPVLKEQTKEQNQGSTTSSQP